MDNSTQKNKLRSLVVILHGYTCKPIRYKHIKKIIATFCPDAEILMPRLNLSLFSIANPHDKTSLIIKHIDKEWATDKYDKLILIGHSCGALLARQVYVYACGENKDAPFGIKGYKKPKVWAANVSRIILLAGINRGWSVNMRLPFWHSLVVAAGALLGDAVSIFGRKFFIFYMKKGAPFITQLRLQWLSMLKQAAEKQVGEAIAVQLLGTVDDLVSPDDNIDLTTGNNFYYLEVPMSGHLSVLQMDNTPAGEKRAEIFKRALLYNVQQLKALQVDTAEHQPEDVTDVIFVIHGIRDAGYWTKKVAHRVQRLGKPPKLVFETATSSYGYFPMLPFLLYSARRKKVEWLMDQYIEKRAKYPNADFSFIGHSNGTYLLAKALEEYPACHFKNVVFAGSVVRQQYDWSGMIKNGRIAGIINLVATADWVVAIFPKTFQTVGIQDLGSGGHDGFSDLDLDPASQVRFIKGGHRAGVEEGMWDIIANLIVQGPASAKNIPNAKKQNNMIRFFGFISLQIVLAAIAALLYLGLCIGNGFSGCPGLQTAALILYVFVLWKIATKA